MARGRGVGSERASRRTGWKAWPGLGRSGRGSPAVALTAVVWWRGEPSYGEGEAQGSDELALTGPREAIYREEEVREGRKAEGHGGVERSATQMARAAAADAWWCEERPRGRARAESRARGDAWK
jgi:hypothetical protein